MKETARQIIEGEITLPDGISYELQNLLGNLLNIEPDERPTAEEVLQHPWFDDCQETEQHGMKADSDIIHLVETVLHDLDQKREMLKKQEQ
jgi:serine/threonine protein kinase